MTTVLMITHGNDHAGVGKVADAIEALGARCVRFDTNRFPGEDLMTLGSEPGRGKLKTAQGEVRLDEVDAVWYRRLRIGSGLPGEMDGQLRAPSIEEAKRSFRGMLATTAPFVMDPYQNIRFAENKQMHGVLASRVGLEVPDSLFSNDPEAVRAFAAAHPDGIVTKMQATFAVYREDEEQVVFTNKMAREDLDDLSGLRYCPMIFQEMIPKERELRVTIVGERIFCAGIDSRKLARAAHDWRREGDSFAKHWEPFALPEAVQAGLLRLMDRLHLNYGAIDVILTPDGRYVFLEVNPCGEFYWLELYADLPISTAIAEVLVGKASRRPNNLHTILPAGRQTL